MLPHYCIDRVCVILSGLLSPAVFHVAAIYPIPVVLVLLLLVRHRHRVEGTQSSALPGFPSPPYPTLTRPSSRPPHRLVEKGDGTPVRRGRPRVSKQQDPGARLHAPHAHGHLRPAVLPGIAHGLVSKLP